LISSVGFVGIVVISQRFKNKVITPFTHPSRPKINIQLPLVVRSSSLKAALDAAAATRRANLEKKRAALAAAASVGGR